MHNNGNTIAAISTPFAQGGIGIIRISGPEAKKIASKVFKNINLKPVDSMKGYQAAFGRVFDKDGDIDEAVLLNFNAPFSYTGEDVVELSIHSGLYLLKRVLRAVIEAGAKLAEGGEFTKRAFLNGKISLTQAESVMDLISAQNRQAANAALMARDGIMFKYISNITDELVMLVGHISAWIDYSEEDIDNINNEEVTNKIQNIKNQLLSLKSTFDFGKIIKEGINTIIVGKPNVGKSTLMNLLSGYNKSIVTDIPGTTRDIIEEHILLDDVMLNLIDTAGLRQTDDVIEQQGVKLAQEKLKQADIVVVMFDNSQIFDDDDRNILEQIKGKLVIAIVNKMDLKSNFDISNIINDVSNIVKVEANRLETRNIISEAIRKTLDFNKIDASSAIVANQRQLSCVENAIENINEALYAIENKYTYDAINVCIECAIESLMELTGAKVADAVINEMFSKFCVGK